MPDVWLSVVQGDNMILSEKLSSRQIPVRDVRGQVRASLKGSELFTITVESSTVIRRLIDKVIIIFHVCPHLFLAHICVQELEECHLIK